MTFRRSFLTALKCSTTEFKFSSTSVSGSNVPDIKCCGLASFGRERFAASCPCCSYSVRIDTVYYSMNVVSPQQQRYAQRVIRFEVILCYIGAPGVRRDLT